MDKDVEVQEEEEEVERNKMTTVKKTESKFSYEKETILSSLAVSVPSSPSAEITT